MSRTTLTLLLGACVLSLSAGCVLEDEPYDSSTTDDTSDTSDTTDTGETKTECEVFTEDGCYWMENVDGLNCWVPAPGDDVDYDTCRDLDSCTEGGGGASGGGCYKWSSGSEGVGANWACDYYAGEACYWMENLDGEYCWVPAPEGDVDETECQVLDSCQEYGGGASGGGCYKWSDDSFDAGDGWDGPAVVDNDNDGVTSDADCDDGDPNRYPGNTEVCDGIDNDCDDALGGDFEYLLNSSSAYTTTAGTTANLGFGFTPSLPVSIDAFEVYLAGSGDASVSLYTRGASEDPWSLLDTQTATLGGQAFHGASGLGWELEPGVEYLMTFSLSGSYTYTLVTTHSPPEWGSYDGFTNTASESAAPSELNANLSTGATIGFRLITDC